MTLSNYKKVEKKEILALTGVESWVVNLHSVITQHVKQSGFACIIKSQEQDFSAFVV